MKNVIQKAECIIAKDLLGMLLKTIEEMALKSGYSLAHHGAKDLSEKVMSSLRDYHEPKPAAVPATSNKVKAKKKG